MWYPATTTTEATTEPVTLAEAKRHLNIFHDDDDAQIGMLILAARGHVEGYCGLQLAGRSIEIKCDGFADFAWLPVRPVQDVSISYVDTTGATQTLSSAVYELRADAGCIALAYGQNWPAIQPRSRITVEAEVGAVVPAAVKHAILLKIADLYENRESAPEGKWTSFDSLLANHRY